MRLILSFFLLSGVALCQNVVNPPSSSGGSCGALAGDVTGTCAANTIKSSVALAGSPTTTTQTVGDNSTKIATDEFVSTAVGSLVPATRNINTTAPLSGGGNLSADRTIALSANNQIRSFGGSFDGGGSALTSGATQTVYFTVPFACTIAAWNITVDAGTITFDVWKIATGTAIPTVANTITASALPAISTGTAVHSTLLTSWGTSVAANDIIGVNINTVATATKASLVIQCNATT